MTAIVLAIFLCGIYGCTGKTDVSGIWKGEATATIKTPYDGRKTVTDTFPIELMLAQTEKNISGKVTFQGKSFTVESGIIVDKIISFQAGVREYNATVNGNSMDGTMSADFYDMLKGQTKITGSFKAKK